MVNTLTTITNLMYSQSANGQHPQLYETFKAVQSSGQEGSAPDLTQQMGDAAAGPASGTETLLPHPRQ